MVRQKAVNMIAKRQFKSECDATRTTTNTTRQIDKQRVISIDDATLLSKLCLKTLASDGISKEQRAGILVINKETVRVRLRCFTSFLDSNTIILLVFHDSNAMTAQFRFFQARASADICTVTLKPMRALIIPIDNPRFPVDPTAILYWLKNCLNSGESSLL